MAMVKKTANKQQKSPFHFRSAAYLSHRPHRITRDKGNTVLDYKANERNSKGKA